MKTHNCIALKHANVGMPPYASMNGGHYARRGERGMADYHRVMDRNGRNVSRVKTEGRKDGTREIRGNETRRTSHFSRFLFLVICARGSVLFISVGGDW